MELNFCGKKVGQIRECPHPPSDIWSLRMQIYRDEKTDFAFNVIANEQLTA